jgi:hypothetical protein
LDGEGPETVMAEFQADTVPQVAMEYVLDAQRYTKILEFWATFTLHVAGHRLQFVK